MNRPPLAPGRRPGVFLCAALLVVSSSLVATGMHRLLYEAGRRLAAPPLAVSVLAGALNLCWYEIGYAVGGGLKMINVCIAIPPIGAATGIVSGLLLLLGVRFARHAVLTHIALSLTLGFLSLCVLLWRLVRGMNDPWRIFATLSFMAMYFAWLAYFLRAGKPEATPAPSAQGTSSRR